MVLDTVEGVAAGTLLRGELASEFIPARPLDIWLPSSYGGAPSTTYCTCTMRKCYLMQPRLGMIRNKRVDEILDSLITDDVIAPTMVVACNGGQRRNFEYFPILHSYRLRFQICIV